MTDLALVEQVERGLPTRTLDTMLKRVDPSGERLKPTDVVPKATYYRLKDGTLPTEHSERVLWLGKVLSELMFQYHDERDLVIAFLTLRHPMLGMRTPYDMAKESISGAELVLELLGQAAAGVAV